MTRYTSDIAFSESVKAMQEKLGSRAQYQRHAEARDWPDEISFDLAQLIETVRSFYLGTASAAGQPYIQHRGGLPGFLCVLGPKTLAFADYGGNRQYITLGNLAENPHAFIFIMDYARRLRVKLWGTARVVTDDPELLSRVTAVVSGRPERVIVFELTAWDRNCPQHIPQLFSAEDVETVVGDLKAQIAHLKAEVARLKAKPRSG
jgi:uncharacterized protein